MSILDGSQYDFLFSDDCTKTNCTKTNCTKMNCTKMNCTKTNCTKTNCTKTNYEIIDLFLENIDKDKGFSCLCDLTDCEVKNEIRYIDVIEDMNYCVGTAMICLWRAGANKSDKDVSLAELEKAKLYIDREILRHKKNEKK